jgi:hypothetical protein
VGDVEGVVVVVGQIALGMVELGGYSHALGMVAVEEGQVMVLWGEQKVLRSHVQGSYSLQGQYEE